MFCVINNGNIVINNGNANYGYYNESKAYVDVIQADVALTATQRLYAHFMIGVDINELLWVLRKAYYLMLGGTASTHKWNAKDLRDLDSAFRLVYGGTITHGANGMQGDAITGFADTKLNAGTLTSINSASLAVFFTNSVTVTPTNWADIGASDGGTFKRFVNRGGFDNSGNKTASGAIGQASPLSDTYSKNTVFGKTYLIATRLSSILNKLWVNGVLENTNSVTNSGSLPSFNIYLLGYNNGGSLIYPSGRTLGCAAVINAGLTDQQAITDSTKTIFGQKILNRA